MRTWSTDAGGRVAVRLTMGVVTALLVTADLRAGSISFSGSTTGAFNNPVGGTSTGVGTDSLSFGSPPGALSFTGTSFTTAADHVFELGGIGFYNSENVNPVMGVDLALALSLTAGGTATPVTLHMTIDNTPTTGQPDTLALTPGTEIGTVVGSDGITYSLLLKGFGASGCTSPTMSYSSTLTANEGQVLCTGLFGELVEKAGPPAGSTPPPVGGTPPGVPEPATMALAAAGLLTAGLRRLRR